MHKHSITKIISGGQTGADRAGLMAGKKLNIETGGWCVKDYRTEDGIDLELKNFGIKCLDSIEYPERTKKNVDDSDGTIVFRLQPSLGSDKTIGYAQSKIWKYGVIKTMNKIESKYKAVCVITNIDNEDVASEQILNFVLKNDIKILNIAGHRESSAPIKNFSEKVERIVYNALK